MKIAVCQINTIIGDIKGNTRKIEEGYKKASEDGADIAVFPELSVCGYPPQDLIEKKRFVNAVTNANKELASKTGNTALIFGSITGSYDEVGTGINNSALFCHNGEIEFVQHKTLLPNYDVFDEVRYFDSAREINVHEFRGVKLGISVCEDIWNDRDYWKKRRYAEDPIAVQYNKGADIFINVSASPYAAGRREERRKMLSFIAREDVKPLVYACCVGAQTDLIFDGASMCFDKEGKLSKLGKRFEEDYFIFDTDKKYDQIESVEGSFEEEVHDGLILGLKDYARKTGFKKMVLGLSGGMDSALVAYLAVKAVGPENVHVIMMPSKYSSKGSIDDSRKLCENLGITYDNISVQPVFEKVLEQFESIFAGTDENIAEENIQSRIRGLYLMAYSNKFNYMLLATGNKSEMAVGYATLYGDMAGALAVIGDIYKTEVYRVANYINRDKEIIPNEIIAKPPSAELKPEQTDQDFLPPYDVLDSILEMYLEKYMEFTEIIDAIGDEETVKKVLKLVDRNEFKRKQAAPVLRVSPKAFGYGRRYPIVQGWR